MLVTASSSSVLDMLDCVLDVSKQQPHIIRDYPINMIVAIMTINTELSVQTLLLRKDT